MTTQPCRNANDLGYIVPHRNNPIQYLLCVDKSSIYYKQVFTVDKYNTNLRFTYRNGEKLVYFVIDGIEHLVSYDECSLIPVSSDKPNSIMLSIVEKSKLLNNAKKCLENII